MPRTATRDDPGACDGRSCRVHQPGPCPYAVVDTTQLVGIACGAIPEGAKFPQVAFASLRKRYWGQRLWARGYRVASSGDVTNEVWIEYIKSQTQPEPDDDFRVTSVRRMADRSAFSRTLKPPPFRRGSVLADVGQSGPGRHGKGRFQPEAHRRGVACQRGDRVEPDSREAIARTPRRTWGNEVLPIASSSRLDGRWLNLREPT